MSQDVWIVDDDHAIRWVLERALQQAQISCRSFEDGQQLLAALESDSPSLIVSDIRMPGIDGLSLLQRLQQQIAHVPVIIMTAHSDLDSAVASYQGGAFDYLPKPFDIDEAVSLVQRGLLHAQQQAWWMQQRASQMGGAPPSQYPQAQHPQVKQEAGLSTEEQQRYASLFSLMLFLHPLCLLIVFQLTVPLNV